MNAHRSKEPSGGYEYYDHKFLFSATAINPRLPYLRNSRLSQYKLGHPTLTDGEGASAAAVSSFAYIPDEVLLMIFQMLLNSPLDLLMMSQVSRKFLSISMKSFTVEDKLCYPFLHAIYEYKVDFYLQRLAQKNINVDMFLSNLFSNGESPHEAKWRLLHLTENELTRCEENIELRQKNKRKEIAVNCFLTSALSLVVLLLLALGIQMFVAHQSEKQEAIFFTLLSSVPPMVSMMILVALVLCCAPVCLLAVKIWDVWPTHNRHQESQNSPFDDIQASFNDDDLRASTPDIDDTTPLLIRVV